MLDIVIVGGGLSGLALAQQLCSAGRSIDLFEARNRFGGRILSRPPYELGPSWIWPSQQPRLARMVQANQIPLFRQHTQGECLYQADRLLPPQRFRDTETYASARRIEGGTIRLIEALLQQLPADRLRLNHRLVSVEDRGDCAEACFECNGEQLTLQTRQLVCTLPPRLVLNTVRFQPELAPGVQNTMQSTATWMAGNAKALIRYPTAFWRAANISGSAFAAYPGAILGEVFDACDDEGKHFALGGFFALPAALRQQYRNDLEALIVAQLVFLFGPEAAKPLEIIIQDWSEEEFTSTQADAAPLNYHPIYGDTCFQLDHWNDKLYFSGTETAKQFGGYLEGALEAAERTARQILL